MRALYIFKYFTYNQLQKSCICNELFPLDPVSVYYNGNNKDWLYMCHSYGVKGQNNALNTMRFSGFL